MAPRRPVARRSWTRATPKHCSRSGYGARQALHIRTVKQASRAGVGEVPKVLPGLAERLQISLALLHLREKGQGALAHLCSAVLLRIGQDLCRLVDPSVGLLERRKDASLWLASRRSRRCCTCFKAGGRLVFASTRARESLTWVTRSDNRSPAASKGDRPSSVTEARTARQEPGMASFSGGLCSSTARSIGRTPRRGFFTCVFACRAAS
jgi:hypothetical protein